MYGSAHRETFKTIQVWKVQKYTPEEECRCPGVRSAVSQNLGRDTHLERKDMGVHCNEEESS